jgi:hypothetical protein
MIAIVPRTGFGGSSNAVTEESGGTMPQADAKKAINETCPWSGKPVHPDALIEHNGHTVGFCSREHRDHFKKALDHFSEAAAKQRGRG